MCTKMTKMGQKAFQKEFKALTKKGYPKERALAASYSVLKKKGYKVPKPKM